MEKLLFEIPTRYIKASGLTLALLAALATGAEAKEARVHAFDCKTFGGKPADRAFALANDSTTEYMVVVCPIADTSAFRKEEIKALNVHVTNNSRSGKIQAQICRSAWGTTGGLCGGPVSALDLGDHTLTITWWHFGEIWPSQNRADFGYLWVILPPKDGGGHASFRGYFTANTSITIQ